MKKSERLARKWMPGYRDGPDKRPAWKHPEDVVKVLTEELPEDIDYVPTDMIVDLAWLHDILEDGRIPTTGTRVTCELMENAGISELVQLGVNILTRKDWISIEEYYDRLYRLGDENVLLVKLADRLCNLREGKNVYSDERWKRYVEETHKMVLPLCSRVLTRDSSLLLAVKWLESEIHAAMDNCSVKEPKELG